MFYVFLLSLLKCVEYSGYYLLLSINLRDQMNLFSHLSFLYSKKTQNKTKNEINKAENHGL